MNIDGKETIGKREAAVPREINRLLRILEALETTVSKLDGSFASVLSKLNTPKDLAVPSDFDEIHCALSLDIKHVREKLEALNHFLMCINARSEV